MNKIKPYTKTQQVGRSIQNYGNKVDDVKEETLQSQCEEYLKLQRLPYIRIPDGLLAFVARTGQPPIKKLVEKYLKGLPDLTIFLPDGKYICVELKSKTGKPTQGQKNFAKIASVYIVRSFDDFCSLVESKLK